MKVEMPNFYPVFSCLLGIHRPKQSTRSFKKSSL